MFIFSTQKFTSNGAVITQTNTLWSGYFDLFSKQIAITKILAQQKRVTKAVQ